MSSSRFDHASAHQRLSDWFADQGRSLPWRDDPSPWRVMMSEFMLQQTPVARVLPVFEAWIKRWPTPTALAQASSAEVLQAWGRLGYPRRAQRLHEAARVIVRDHNGTVPNDLAALLALPGVGDYTAAAIHSFAFGGRAVVLDTNVRRVFARLVAGVERPGVSVSRAERELALALLPEQDADAAQWAAATMELGALVCTARAPDCAACPVREACAWRSAGYPESELPKPRGQAWAGTDRQCRGRLMAVLREAEHPVSKPLLDVVWPDADQRERCLDSLLDDELVSLTADGLFQLGAGD